LSLAATSEVVLVQQAREVPRPHEAQLVVGRGAEAVVAALQPGEAARPVAPGDRAVAAGEGDDEGGGGGELAAQLEHGLVAGEEGGLGERPVADGVVGGPVDAGDEVNEVGSELAQDDADVGAHGVEVGGVVDVGAEGDGGGLDGGGVVPVAVVDGEGVDAAVGGEDRAGAVAVVHVEVDDEGAAVEAERALLGDRDGDVVEDAEAAAGGGAGVVKAAAEVDRHAAGGEGDVGGEHGAADHAALQIEDALGVAVADRSGDDLAHGGGGLRRLDVRVAVDPQDRVVRGERGLLDVLAEDQALAGEGGQDALAADLVEGGARPGELILRPVDEAGRERPPAREDPVGPATQVAEELRLVHRGCSGCMSGRRGQGGLLGCAVTGPWHIWIDRGGTFTDCVGREPETGALRAVKLLSSDQAPLLAIRRLLGLAENAVIPPCRVRMGTTLATNALLERRGAACGLAISRGFGDLLAIGDQTRPELFALAIPPRPQLHSGVLEVDARLAADGAVLVRPEAGSYARGWRRCGRRGCGVWRWR
jgi:hypothetical protein